MKNTINRFVRRNRTLFKVLGILAIIGGITLACLSGGHNKLSIAGGFILFWGIVFASWGFESVDTPIR